MSTALKQIQPLPQDQPADLQQAYQHRLEKYWHYYSDKGCESHHCGRLKEACGYFLECVRISRVLIDDGQIQCNHQKTSMDCFYIASHNLASCYNGQNQSSEAEKVLNNCHTTMMATLQNQSISRALRLETLCVLKKSLFSLASQLAHMNKPAEIHTLINTTEAIANKVEKELALPIS